MSLPDRLSGSSSSRAFWRLFFRSPPTILLDGKIVGENVFEVQAGEDGYVVVEVVDADGKPVLANVTLPDGEVLERVFAKRTLFGNVKIVPMPERYS